MFKSILKAIQEEFSGEEAKSFVGEIIRFHRIQASPGFREAANLCLNILKESKVKAEILSFPADGATRYWTSLMPEEWDIEGASLWLISPENYKLADFRDNKLSIIQRSAPTPLIEREVVLVEDGEEDKDYKGIRVKDRIVLTKGDISRVYDLAVERRGALGIIFDGMREIPKIRTRMDLPDALQYTSFWWNPGDKKCFGFVISPRQGEKLRQFIKQGKRVIVKCEVKSRFYKGEIEIISGLLSGESNEEILLTAHLCHPQPSANDNGSGCGCLLETARTLSRLIECKRLPKPKRGIRFLLVPEMTGTYAWLASNEKKVSKIIAGLNLDMVGENQEMCGSSLLIENPPLANSSFTSTLLESIREEIIPELKTYGGTGGYATFRYATTPFSGGSDHYILSDPSVGIPCPMIIQWPDRFYHTSLDTLDKVDPEMLKRVGIMAGTYLYFLANAERKETQWLGYEMIAGFKQRIIRMIQELYTRGLEEDRDGAIRIKKRIGFLTDREFSALESLKRLGNISLKDLKEEVASFVNREMRKIKRIPEEKTRRLDRWERKAEKLIPKRVYPGPISLSSYLYKLKNRERDKLYRLRKEHKDTYRILPVVALYWCNGGRNLLEISNLVEDEIGMRDVKLLVRYFEILKRLGLVEIRNA